jgi:uncharacterized protein with PQ loop repeat
VDSVVAELLAWCGAVLSCLLCLPQAVRTLRLAERLDGISPGTYWIVLANATVWVTWSLLTGELAVGAPALVNGPAAVLILRRIAAARLRSRAGLATADGLRLTENRLCLGSGTMSR